MDIKKLLTPILAGLLAVAIIVASVLGVNLSNTGTQLADMTALQSETEGTLEATEATLASTQATLTETEGTLAATQATLAETEGKLAETEGTLATTQATLTETEGKLAETEGTLAAAQATLTETEGRLAETEGTLAATQATLTETEGKLAETEGTLAATQATLTETEGKLAETEGPLAATQATLTETEGTLATTQAALTETEGTLATTQAALTETEGTLAATQAALTETEGTLAATQATLTETEGTLATTQAALTETEGKLTTAEARIAELEARIAELEAAEAQAAKEGTVELVDINGYHIAVPAHYTRTSAEEDGSFYYYYYGDGGDFIMIMPFDMTGMDDWMKSEAMLPYVYQLCYESVAEAAGSNATSTYRDITVNNGPGGYGESSMAGISLDYVLYYGPGMDDLMIICYANVTNTYTGIEMLQPVIDNTCLTSQTPADMTASVPVDEQPVVEIPALQAGDVITFGSFEQDDKTSNGAEPVRWVVLTVEGDKAFVVTEKALLGRVYHETDTAVTWETCSMRSFLNEVLFPQMFTPEEQAAVIMTTVTDPEAPGVVTEDLLFLLSATEVETYLNNSTRNIYPTKYATTHQAAESALSGLTWWWLRSPGKTSNEAKYVSNSTIGEHPGNIKSDTVTKFYAAGDWSGAVRPAMWVDLTKLPAEAFE